MWARLWTLAGLYLTIRAGFKIYEDGLDSKGEWAVTRLYNNKGKTDFVLPSCVPAGQ
jgi:hypothetical protein